MNRKHFILQLAGIAGTTAWLQACNNKAAWKASITGANSAIGHMLQQPVTGEPVSVTEKQVVIIGSGVSGLSAARRLYQQNIQDIVLLDLDDIPGGNSKWASNDVSAYPCGAHYVPTPNLSLTEYLDFLQEAGVITGHDTNGLPVYNELHLCFDPEERLYINGRWQEGLVPQFGVPAEDSQQIKRFLEQMHHYRLLKGTDGKDAFAIPVDRSSKDGSLTVLDQQTMLQWLQQNGYNSKYLLQYVNYCCRDDYGTTIQAVSAWAGIHYFASRKGKAANAGYSDVLTWPEGNGFLVKQLIKDIHPFIHTGCLATGISIEKEKAAVTYYDAKDKQLKKIIAGQCILAVPQYIVSRILKNELRAQKVKTHMQYVPWMVATLTVKTMSERTGAAMSWDNVLYDSDSLGFVDATHQFTTQHTPRKNLTYYLPLTDKVPAEARRNARELTAAQWTTIIIDDLKKVYPDIEASLEEVKITVWGHAMAQPLPGIIHGDIRQQLAASIDDKIHFAHSDLAGISIFEEAFYQGLAAADKVLAQISKNTQR